VPKILSPGIPPKSVGDNTDPSRRWWTAAQAADYAQVGPRTILRAAAEGKLRVARVGGRRESRFLLEWVDAWIDGAAR